MNKSKELKIGAIIAYLTIAINVISGILYTPWMIERIGDSDYGLYTLATSLINLFLFDFGLSAATSRFVAKYLAEGRQDKVDRILGTIYKLYFIIDAIICIILIVISVFLEQIYTNLSPIEIQRLRVVFVISAAFSVINFPCVTFTGILNAYEKFITLKSADALYRIFSVLITVVALLCNGGLYALVLVHVIVGLLVLLYKFYVIKAQTPVRVNFCNQEKGAFGDLLGFSMWITISSLFQRLIFGVTPSILGIVSNTAAIAVFGIVSLMENYIHIVTTALNGMFISRVSRIFNEHNYETKLNELIVKVARFQFALYGLIMIGFFLLGEDFVLLWLDESYSAVYYGLLLVTLPGLFFYPLQIANTAMIMNNKVKFQAITNMIVGVLNVALAFVWSREYGVLGACMAIFVAYNIRNIGYFVAYRRILKLNVKKLFLECYLPLGACMLLTLIVGIGINYFWTECNWLSLAIKVVVIVVVYFGLAFAVGMRQSEKKVLINTLLTVLRKRAPKDAE